MYFPLWQYLNQPLWDRDRPLVCNPIAYWQQYRRIYLHRCFHHAFLEQCWQTNYQTFVMQYRDFCARDPREEDPRWLAERCWRSELHFRAYEHPENQNSGTECS
ncbi:MAG: hypothetical protein F6K00_28775 [Leptolyngbya sp. SIOISBB]|nr:hypothetical protein [Leptolyngbya sp. SIOISBB]